MAIGHVVTRGYGTGTLAGDVNLVVLRGYTAGEPAPEPESEISPTGGWSVDPYGYETRRRAALRKEEEQEEARRQADEIIARAQDSAREALRAKEPRESAILDAAEVSRLIDALEQAQATDRRRRLAAVLLLMS